MLDGVPEETKEFIHEYWSKFPPQNPLILDIAGVFFFFLWSLNLFGNGTIIYVFLKTKTLRTSSNIFVINLAFSDLIMMVTHGPPLMFNITQRTWAFGKLGCQLYGALGGICGVNAILTMVIIGYDRHNVIVKGLLGKKISPNMAFLTIVGCWSYATACHIPPFFGWGGYGVEGLLVTCSFDYISQDWNKKSYMIYAMVFNYCVPMILITFFYVQIVKAVWAHEASLKEQAKKMNVESLRSNAKEGESAEFKIAKVAIINVVLWVVTWTPYAVTVFTACFIDRNLITPIIAQLPSFLLKTTCCFNPIVFAVSHPKFREAISKNCPCLGGEEKKKKETEPGTVNTQT